MSEEQVKDIQEEIVQNEVKNINENKQVDNKEVEQIEQSQGQDKNNEDQIEDKQNKEQQIQEQQEEKEQIKDEQAVLPIKEKNCNELDKAKEVEQKQEEKADQPIEDKHQNDDNTEKDQNFKDNQEKKAEIEKEEVEQKQEEQFEEVEQKYEEKVQQKQEEQAKDVEQKKEENEVEQKKEDKAEEVEQKQEEKAAIVEKIPLPQHIQQYFMEGQTIESIDFDIFGLHSLNQGNELAWLTIYLFQYKYDLCQELKIDPKKLFAFTDKISQGYRDNPYHNRIHAFDVTATVNFFLSTCQFNQIGNLSKLDQAYLYLSTVCHDYEHEGVNNLYLINTRSELALTYNDKSPLENHHASASFCLMRQKEYDILENLSKEDFNLFRSRMISIILETDMSLHIVNQAKLKARIESEDFDPKTKDKYLCMDQIMHCADISNPFKPFTLYELWAKRVLDEFWNQGDLEREKKIPISYLCDRYTVNTARSQIGFIDFVVKPFYQIIAKFMPIMQPMLQVLDDNKQKWALQIDFWDTELARISSEQKRTTNSIIGLINFMK